jgi:hypothetical protein
MHFKKAKHLNKYLKEKKITFMKKKKSNNINIPLATFSAVSRVVTLHS